MKKWKDLNKKQRIWLIVGIAAACLILALVLWLIFKPESGTPVVLNEVKRGNIEQTIKTTATVESNDRETFVLPKGVLVSTVNVKPGDKVHAGDVLATFNTASLNQQLAEKQTAYNNALQSYNQAISSNQSAKQQLIQTKNQITDLQGQIDRLQAQLDAAANDIRDAITAEPTTMAPVNLPDITDPQVKPITQEQLDALRRRLIEGGASEEQADQIIEAIKGLSVEQAQKIIGQIVSQGGASLDEIIAILNEALGNIKLPGVDLDIDRLVETIDQATQLAQLKTQLLEKQTQKALLEAQSGISLGDTLKLIVDATKASLDETEQTISQLSAGWVATGDGLVTQVNIKAGEFFGGAPASSTSMDLSKLMELMSNGMDMSTIMDLISQMSGASNTGMVVEQYDQFVASFTAGKYDILKIKLGQHATVTSAGGTFDGIVTYIAPTADSMSGGSGGFSLSAITSGLTGGSSAGVTVKVKIENPDDSVILGMDVDLDIDVGVSENVIVIPMETLQLDGDGKYVFVFDEEEKTVEKKPVVIGASSDTAYEIKSGLNIGDRIVKNPSTKLMDGEKVLPQREDSELLTTEK